jgi:hypothetical protein
MKLKARIVHLVVWSMKSTADLRHMWAARVVQPFHFVQFQEYKLFVQYFINLVVLSVCFSSGQSQN